MDRQSARGTTTGGGAVRMRSTGAAAPPAARSSTAPTATATAAAAVPSASTRSLAATQRRKTSTQSHTRPASSIRPRRGSASAPTPSLSSARVSPAASPVRSSTQQLPTDTSQQEETAHQETEGHSTIHATALNQQEGDSFQPSASLSPSPSASASSPSLPWIPVGSARLSDLDPVEKSKIGSLFREIVSLKKSSEELAHTKSALEQQVVDLEARSNLTTQEAESLRMQYQNALQLIAEYQLKLKEAEEKRAEAGDTASDNRSGSELIKRSEVHQPSTPSPTPTPSPPSDNPTVTRLHELSERARAAAKGSPLPYRPPSSAGSSHTFTPSPSATVPPPFSSSRALASTTFHSSTSTAEAIVPPVRSNYSTDQHNLSSAAPRSVSSSLAPSFSTPSYPAGYSTDEEQPRSTGRLPVPIVQTRLDPRSSSPVSSSALPPSSFPSSPGLAGIEQEFHRTLSQARRDLDEGPVQRRLQLESAVVSAAISPIMRSRATSPEGSSTRPLSSFSLAAATNASSSSSSLQAPSSPPRSRSVKVHAASSPTLPEDLALLPTAVSGVTRTLALSSPESIEKRVMQLAQQMFDKRMREEERRKEQERERDSRGSRPSERGWEGSLSRASSREPEEEKVLDRPSKPPGARSLSSFFSAHPLTSQLSPLAKRPQRSNQSSPRESRRSSPHASPSRRSSTAASSQHPPPAAAAPSAAPSSSSEVSSLLNHSLRLAQSYAAERRARSAASGAPSLAASTRRAPHEDEDAAPSTSSVAHAAASVPDSPFSQVLTPAQVAALTPTSRKIHRLLLIQNPAAAKAHRQASEQAKQREQEERAFREKEERMAKEMDEKRQLEELQAKAKRQAQEMRATESARPPLRPASSSSSSSSSSHPLTSRSKSPADTYVPPPFSYRASSRASVRTLEESSESDSHDQIHSPGPSSTSYAPPPLASHATSPALSSLSHTPGSVATHHPNAHTSFVSPLSTRSQVNSSRPTPHDADAEADEEMWDLFHLKSPRSVQQREEEEQKEMRRRLQQGQPQPPPQQTSMQHPYAPRQDVYAKNFANDMLQAAARHRAPQQKQFAGVAYPTAGHSAPSFHASKPPHYPPSATAIRTSPPDSPSRLQSKLESLHLQQLERDLEDLMPQVIQELTQSQRRKTTTEHNGWNRPQASYTCSAQTQAAHDQPTYARTQQPHTFHQPAPPPPRSSFQGATSAAVHPLPYSAHDHSGQHRGGLPVRGPSISPPTWSAWPPSSPSSAHTLAAPSSFSPSVAALSAPPAHDFDTSLLDLIEQIES